MGFYFGGIYIEIPKYIIDIVNCIKYLVITFIVYFLYVNCVIPMMKIIISKVEKVQRKKEIQFNEFDDFDKMEQDETEREQLENEWEFIEKSYSEMYPNDEVKVRKNMDSIKILDTFEKDEENVTDGVSIRKLLEDDNSFDVNLFKKWSKNIFECVLLGNVKRLEQVKNCLAENIVDRKVRQLNQFEEDGIELRRENVVIEDLKIIDYIKGIDKTGLKVYVKVSLKEYICNKKTKKVLRGSKKKISEKSYVMTFYKIDSEDQEGFIENCDVCGAAITETEFCICKYCGSLVNPIRYNWMLVRFEVV